MILHMEWEEYEEMLKNEALETGREEGREEGLSEGIERGLKKGFKRGREGMLKDLIQKKLRKGKSPEEIADDLEQSVDTIRRFIDEMKEYSL